MNDDPLPPARVLVVEDDREIAELVAVYLEREGLAPSIAGSAEEAVIGLEGDAPSLLVLDLGLPGADGLDFIKYFRSRSEAPVIVVSARESDEDKIEALGLGADDFVTKPFSPKVLVARAKAQLRRASLGGALAPSRKLAFGPYALDFDGKVVERDGRRIPLSRKEFELLAFLAEREGRTFGPQELYREVWGLEHGDLSTVAVHIQRLRRKIEGEGAAPRWIVTVPGAGYRFLRSGEEG